MRSGSWLVLLLEGFYFGERFVGVFLNGLLATLAADEDWLVLDHHFDRYAHRTERLVGFRAELLLFRERPVLGGKLVQVGLNAVLFGSRRWHRLRLVAAG